MVSMDTEPRDNTQGRRYQIDDGGRPIARIDYRLGDGFIDLLHTEVAPDHEGQGLASKLAKHALEDARSRGLKVVATCEYVRGYVDKHPEYAALLRR